MADLEMANRQATKDAEQKTEMDREEFIEMCSEAVANKDARLLEWAVARFAEYCFKEPTDATIDEQILSFLDETFRSTPFLEMSGSWHLLMVLEWNWSAFTDRQRAILLDAIEFTFDKLADPMSWFVLSEILGEYYCSASALEVLKRLSKVSADGPRSQVPHGLEHIAKSTADPALRARAIHDLLRMQSDRSDDVKAEVVNSIQRLKAAKKL